MADEYICNDKGICKKCIYYDKFYCRNNKTICVNNSEYRNAKMLIKAIINQKKVVEESAKKIAVPVLQWTSNKELLKDVAINEVII